MPPRPLIVRLRNWVGDVVLSIPALQLLEKHGYELHLVGRGRWAPALLAGHGWPVHLQPRSLRERVKQLRDLRAAALARDPAFRRRENALVLPTSFSSAMEMRLAGLKAVGYAHEGRSLLLSRSEAMSLGGHALVSYWTLASRFLGIPVHSPPPAIPLCTAPAAQRQADELLQRHGVRAGFVVICPFAGGTFETLDKTWPRFAEFSRALLERGHEVLACPGPGEEAIIRDHHPGVKLLPAVDLGTYGALLRRAALVVANDTGPGHLAAAVGAPLLSVLGPTKPEQWQAWGPTVQVVRRWPGWPSVAEVMERAIDSLRTRPGPCGPEPHANPAGIQVPHRLRYVQAR